MNSPMIDEPGLVLSLKEYISLVRLASLVTRRVAIESVFWFSINDRDIVMVIRSLLTDVVELLDKFREHLTEGIKNWIENLI